MAKNRIIYSVVLLIVFSFVGLYENKITYTALYAALLLPILCMLYMLLSGKKLNISERMSTHTVKKGEVSRYFFTVKNNSPFPYPIIKAVFQSGRNGDREKNKINEKNYSSVISDPKECFLSLSPHESKEIVFDISGQFRGTFYAGVCRIYFYDPLGLICFLQKREVNTRLTVMPNAIEIPYLQVSDHIHTSESGKAQSGSFDEDYTSVEQLKKYTPADGYKKIHWKLSAKKNELISKEYQAVSVKSAVMIVYNTGFSGKRTPFEDMVCEDKLIEAAVSVIAYCEKHMINISLHYLSEGFSTSIKYPEDLYTAVSDIKFNESLDFDKFLFDIKKLHNSEYRENIFMFTHNINELFCSTVKTLCLLGNQVIIFCFLHENINKKTSEAVYRDKEDQNKIKQLQTAGAVCYILSKKRNAADAVSG